MNSEDEKDFLDEIDQANEGRAETPEPEQPEVETGEPETATTTEATPATETPKEPATVPLAALKAEREKRQQEAEARKQLERELERLRAQAQQVQQPEQPLDFYADPEGYVRTVAEQIQHEANHRLYAVLDAQARESLPDYDEAMEWLLPRVEANPALKSQIFGSANPAKAAYQLSKQMQLAEQIQDPVTFEQQMRERIRAEVEAELKAKSEAAAATARAIPPDLAGTRSAASRGAGIDGDPFQELFPN